MGITQVGIEIFTIFTLHLVSESSRKVVLQSLSPPLRKTSGGDSLLCSLRRFHSATAFGTRLPCEDSRILLQLLLLFIISFSCDVELSGKNPADGVFFQPSQTISLPLSTHRKSSKNPLTTATKNPSLDPELDRA